MANNDKKCETPCWCYFVIAILVIIIVLATFYGIKSLTTSYEKDKSEKKNDKESVKNDKRDESYDIQIEKIGSIDNMKD